MKNQSAEILTATAKYKTALEAARNNPSNETRAAATAASRALSEILPTPKQFGFASRAGKQQTAERRARYQR